MNGEMNSLKDVEYNLSHDINTIKDLNYQQLALVKSEIESELNKLFEVLQKVSYEYHLDLIKLELTHISRIKCQWILL